MIALHDIRNSDPRKKKSHNFICILDGFSFYFFIINVGIQANLYVSPLILYTLKLTII